MKLPAWITRGSFGLSEKDSGKDADPKDGRNQNATASSARATTSNVEAGHVTAADKEMTQCLSTFDLVSLGVGSCCGSGIYLTAGMIASTLAGPSGIISFFLAGLASLLSGLHFAKLATIFPHTSGSAYVYAYVTIGELSAFIIGWGLIVEYMIGTAAAAIALSETLDTLFQEVISTTLEQKFPSVSNLDPLAALVCLVLTGVLATGVELSAKVNNFLNLLNLLVWSTFIVASFILGNSNNWTRGRGTRGLFPFGVAGVWKAVPVAYFAFVGFDGLASTGAECKTPGRSIPAAIVLSILINIVVFASVVLALTYDVDYRSLLEDTAVVDVFPMLGYPFLKYIMAVGAVSGLFAATFGSLFPLPRVVQAMAQDGLIFRYFSHIHPTRHTAMRATIFCGTVSALLAAFVDLKSDLRAALTPLISIFTALINMYLMASLSLMAWALFLAWMFFGLSVYYFYGLSLRGLTCSKKLASSKEGDDVSEVSESDTDTSPLLST
ncbi:cationic amino acid transporter 2 [Plakobranchus ocellatus]|uniref:Cationic amino acid transporter 2 n=1 Tax=Plakobranchus ocellatus TaxID=259542 RepID=A0AAV4CPH1_9GAST|nr:cationic amino acid transporter 2 [Plakobranchus ocellatus]